MVFQTRKNSQSQQSAVGRRWISTVEYRSLINRRVAYTYVFHSPYTCSQVFIGFNLHSGYNLCFLAVFSISCFVVDLLNLPCWGLSSGSNRRRSSSKQTCRCTKVRIYTKSIIKFISINPQLFCLLYKCMHSICNSIKW